MVTHRVLPEFSDGQIGNTRAASVNRRGIWWVAREDEGYQVAPKVFRASKAAVE